MPDEDTSDVDEQTDNEENEIDDGNPCSKIANSDGEYTHISDKKFKCGCLKGYFWANPGCKKISYPNICTGASACYSTWERIDCREPGEEFYGQDAQYAKLGYCIKQDFSRQNSVKDEPTYFDNNLKIEWMNKFSDKTYNWYDAFYYCRDLKYGGYDDWRLPLPQELLLFYIKSGVSLWSDQLLANKDDSYAWKLDPSTMKLSYAQKTEQNNVRCVRGDPIDVASSFKSIDTYLAVDYKNGLMWSTANFTRDKMWNEALTECENSTVAGFSDWRLPNIHELVTLLNLKKSDPASDFPYPENIPVYFWSSTTLKSNIEESPGVTIYGSGGIKNLDKSGVTKNYEYNMNRVICVRNELCKENYFWNGVDCVESPCSGDPCKKDVHSDGVCHFESTETYSCGCVENYFWDGTKCINPCDAKPCKNHEHSDNKCVPRDKMRYTCGCEEGSWWWGQNKGCLEKKPDLAHICTGQTKCYDDEKEIECPEKGEKYYGQDAQYADLGYCAPPDYTIEKKVENEPVVIDNYTGLSWQQKVYSPETSVPWSNYKNYCNNSTYGGYDDWRLPSILEYRSIMDFGRHHPNVDPKYFPNTPPEYFVTSDFTISYCGDIPYVTENREILMISFDHMATSYRSGWCELDPKIKAPARCVRGNKSFSERSMSELNVSETKSLYVDNKNDLLWAGAPGGEKWDEALDYCENMTFAGLSDWRLTNINESSLFIENLNNIDPAYSYYHSSTTEEYDPTRSVQDKLKIRGDYMLCVRDNPCETGELWDGTKCMKNPCADLPCKDIEHSDKKICTPVSEDVYSCSCNYYYYWNFNSLKCIESCKSQPCEGKSYSTKECFDDDFKGYSCGCVEGYSWDSASKRCVKDETPDEAPDTDTDEIPDIDTDDITDSDTDIAETPDETNDDDGE